MIFIANYGLSKTNQSNANAIWYNKPILCKVFKKITSVGLVIYDIKSVVPVSCCCMECIRVYSYYKFVLDNGAECQRKDINIHIVLPHEWNI